MSAGPTGQELFKEIFLEKKCGVDSGTHDAFFKWCAGYSTGVEAKCNGITNSKGMTCDIKAKFLPENITLEPPNFPQVPTAMEYSLTCPNDIQPSKSIVWGDKIEKFADREDFMKYSAFCYQEVWGVPNSMPWWLIVLIVLGSLLLVSVAATLFWKYYLKKLFGKSSGHKSTLNTQFTSAPISSASVMDQKNKPRSFNKKHTLSSQRQQMIGSEKSISSKNSFDHSASIRSASIKTLKV